MLQQQRIAGNTQLHHFRDSRERLGVEWGKENAMVKRQQLALRANNPYENNKLLCAMDGYAVFGEYARPFRQF